MGDLLERHPARHARDHERRRLLGAGKPPGQVCPKCIHVQMDVRQVLSNLASDKCTVHADRVLRQLHADPDRRNPSARLSRAVHVQPVGLLAASLHRLPNRIRLRRIPGRAFSTESPM